jgi:hypothetical protein
MRLLVALSLTACAADPVMDAQPPPDQPPAGAGYHVRGNTIYTGDGQPHRFRGMSRPSLEWSSGGDMLSSADIGRIASWHANVVRVPLAQSFWLADSKYYDPGYATRVAAIVQWANAADLDVILDLHRSDRGDATAAPQQQRMADARSIRFWSEVAAKFGGNPRVVFELYNEPHDITWSVWRDGGDSGDGFTAAGMQQLYDAIRGAGTGNLVIAGGLDFAYDLRGVPDNRIAGTNIVYATHPYAPYPTKAPDQWSSYWGFLAATDPIVVTEFGDISGSCSAAFDAALIDYARTSAVSWTAWAWYPAGCTFPSLIADWSDAPTASGQVVRTALMESQ